MLTVIFIVTIIIGFGAVLYRSGFTRRSRYRSTHKLCTKTEQNFLNQLLNQLPLDKVYVSAKVRLADLAMPQNAKDIAAFNKVAKKHVDFVICDRRNSSILACIELDDSSHFTASARKRDYEKNRALSDANIPLFRVPTARGYTTKIKQILHRLDLASEGVVDSAQLSANKKKSDNQTVTTKRRNNESCPRCTKTMRIVDMKWINKGNHFHECDACGFRTEPIKTIT